MTSPQSKKKRREKLKSKRGSEEGRLYEKLALLLLAKKGYELSKRDNSKFREFAIGREVGIGKDEKFDDVVFSYIDEDKRKNFIFVQIKHKQDDDLIDSQVLSAEAATAKNVGGSDGGLCRDFNLQKYFISYLSARDELKITKCEELKGGKIKYVALFTNIALDSEELNKTGFSLKEAPDDIVNLFTLKKSALETQCSNHCYQLRNVSEGLRKILKKSSGLDRLAREMAKYVVWEDYRMNRTMGIDEIPIKHYHFGLGKYVIKKSDQIKDISTEKQTKSGQYCEAQFRDDFIGCDETVPNLRLLRNALFDAIRDLDESKKDVKDDELKRILKEAKWKTVPSFGKSKQNIKPDLPLEWLPVKDEDITEFLQYLVFIVEQPRVTELEMLYKSSIQRTVVEDTSLKQFLDTIYDSAPEFRNCVGKVLGINTKKTKCEWISCGQIETFIEQKKQLVSRTFVVSAMALMYKNEITQYGKFDDVGKMAEHVDSFLESDCKVLCVITPVTLLSSIKLLQHLDTEKDLISVNLDTLKCTENRNSVLKAFELEINGLLTIECRHAFMDQDVEQFFYKLFNIAKRNSNKLILTLQKENYAIFTEHFKTDFIDEEMCVLGNDSIDLKDFEPKEDPFKKKVIIFQGQDKRVSLCDITGIDSWNSYVHSLSRGTNEKGVIDGMILVKILNCVEIEVGSKPRGTNSLEGAYAQMCEEINVETLVNKLLSQEDDNNANDMYIISGITGSSEKEKKGKLIQYLRRDNEKEEFKHRLEEFKNRLKIINISNLKVADDQFNYSKFKEHCHIYPEKRIFWISIEYENDVTKFILQEIYNPKFYLKRKFKNVIMKKDLKEHLIKEYLSEIFIFYCAEGKKELHDFMGLNAREIEQFESSCMIKIRFQKSDAEADFDSFKKKGTAHLFEFEKKQLVWCESHDSVKNLQKYIDYKPCETSLVEENNFIRKIKNRKVVIFADDPGMGKTTTLIKLYETEIESSSVIKSNWVIGIKLRDHLEAVGDLEFKKDDISIVSVVRFLSNIDSKLNNNLAENILKNALVKSENFQGKPLLLVFDGFDEVLDEDDRSRILLLLKFIKNKTAAKLWVTTRCHFKTLLEEELSTIAFQFSPMDDTQKTQYITEYLQHRLYLILNNEKYAELFDTEDERQNNEKIRMYASAFINKMQSIFRGDIATFIGTPLQLYLMLEVTIRDFKKWIEEGEGQFPDLKFIGNDICEVYEKFIKRKYDVYFQKRGNRERVHERLEKYNIDRYHKDLAVSKIREINANNDFEQFKDIFLLVGIIKSQGNDLEFIHKTFEEFFASKAFIDWIRKAPETDKQEYLLKVILLKTDYELVRTFMNLQLQKLSERARKDERPNELDKSQEHYGTIAAKLLNEEKNPLIDVNGTPLYIAAKENNKGIALFLLNSLKGHSDALRKLLFAAGEFITRNDTSTKGTALHLACWIDDVEMVKILLDAAEGISEDTLQEFLKYLDHRRHNALTIAAMQSHNVQILNELLCRSNNKLDLILTGHSALCYACFHKNEEFVDFLLQQFEHDKHSLKKLLLYNDAFGGNALSNAKCINVVEKLISAAKSIEDNNETLKNLLLPEEGNLPLIEAVRFSEIDIVVKLLSVAKEIGDDNLTLKQLLLNERYKRTPLHVAAKRGCGDIIKLLLETAADLGIENLNELITAVDEKGKNVIQLMIEHGYERIFYDSFKMLKDEYPIIWEKVMEMFDNVPLESKLCRVKEELLWAILYGNIREVKDILSNVKHSSDSPNESLKILLLAEFMGSSTLCIACDEGNLKIIKELLFYAVHMEDEGETLKKLLNNCPLWPSPFQPLNHGYTRKIKKIVESLIFEARIFSREHAVNILEHINNQYTKETFFSEESDDISVESEDTSEESEDTSEESEDTSEESDDILEESDDISEESDDISVESDDTAEELGDILEESDDTSEESDDILEELDDIAEESNDILETMIPEKNLP